MTNYKIVIDQAFQHVERSSKCSSKCSQLKEEKVNVEKDSIRDLNEDNQVNDQNIKVTLSLS